MKAAVLVEYGRIEWREVKQPVLDSDEVLVRVGYAGICGSDQHVYRGEFKPRTSLPLIQGHEFGGTIAQVGRAVEGRRPGDRVAVDPIYWCGKCAACELGHWPACSNLKLLGVDSDGGFAQFVAVKDFMLYRLPDQISDRDAAMVEMLSIGFHACNRAGLKPGHSVAIFGSGRIGQSILQAARTITDADLFMVDILSSRLDIAKRTYGNITPVDATKCDSVAAIREATGGRGVDVAFEAVGHAKRVEPHPSPVVQCVDAIRGAGTVCVLGLSDQPTGLVMKKLIWKEARLIASRVTHGEFARTIDEMAKGNLHPEALVSEILQADQAQHAFELLANRPADYLKILLTMIERK